MGAQSIEKIDKEALKDKAENIIIKQANNNYLKQYFLLDNCKDFNKAIESLIIHDMIYRNYCENNLKIEEKYGI